jgi:hypothetical protein
MEPSIKKLYEALLWPVILIFLLASLLIALQWYSSLDLEGFSISNFSIGYLVLAMLTHAVSLACFILAWHRNIQLHTIINMSFLQSSVMVGIYCIGKYTPGKVWGMVARGLALHRISLQGAKVIQATLTEQLALLHSGVMAGSLAYLAMNKYYGSLTFALPLFLFSVWWASLGGHFILKLMRLIGRKKLEAGFTISTEFKKSYLNVFVLFTIIWILGAVVLNFCIKSYSNIAGPGPFETLVILVGASFGGFAAFFSIAGLGIREGIMVAALSPYLGISAAVYISLIHRMITVAFDMALGMVAVLLLKSKFSIDEEQSPDTI